MNVELTHQVGRTSLIERLLADPEEIVYVRHDTKLTLEPVGPIDTESGALYNRLDEAGLFEQPRAEGFMAGLLVGTTVAIEEMMFPDLYPEVEDVDAEEIVAELEALEAELEDEL